MEVNSYKMLRHQLRTSLNHIIGYSEILQQDATDLGLLKHLNSLEKVSHEADKLKNLIYEYFRDDEHKFSMEEIEGIKKILYVPVYEILGLTQEIKQQFPPGNGSYFVNDLTRILKSANELLDLIDSETQKLFLNRLAEDEDIPLEKRFISGKENLLELNDASGSILIVDDEVVNRDLLTRHLGRQGYEVTAASSGEEALEILKEYFFDLIILDIMMPGMNGFTVLETIKHDDKIAHIPVIIMSALDDMNSVSHCIELGAEDYLPKTFEPVILKARVEASIEKKKFRDKEIQYINALVNSQKALENELAEAGAYVKSLLPERLTGPLYSDWIFLPSTQLGGDCFNYHWIDDNHFAMYVIDVSGHGIGAALLSVSVVNILRRMSLGGIDFCNPRQVLQALNSSFKMEQQHDMYFTIWYGVYQVSENRLLYSSAGAAPAVLVSESEEGTPFTEVLKSPGVIIGIRDDIEFELKEKKLSGKWKLFLLSDGIYEVHKRSGQMMHFDEFVSILVQQNFNQKMDLHKVVSTIQGLTGTASFRDDVSLIEICNFDCVSGS